MIAHFEDQISLRVVYVDAEQSDLSGNYAVAV